MSAAIDTRRRARGGGSGAGERGSSERGSGPRRRHTGHRRRAAQLDPTGPAFDTPGLFDGLPGVDASGRATAGAPARDPGPGAEIAPAPPGAAPGPDAGGAALAAGQRNRGQRNQGQRRARRIACVALPELALQILRRDRTDWRDHPIALVPEDAPNAPLVAVDARARKLRLRTGMRYGAARGLVPDLRAGVVSEARLDAMVDELAGALATFSPRVEPDPTRPGVFHVDPAGLRTLYGSLRVWAKTVDGYLRGRGLRAVVVVGFDRGLTHAIAAHHAARGRRGPVLLRGAADERDAARAIPLTDLDLDPDLRDGLGQLGATTLGAMIDLPEAELVARFGVVARDAWQRHAAAAAGDATTGPAALPLQPRRADDPVTVPVDVDPPDHDAARLLFAVKGGLHAALRRTAARGEALAALRLDLDLERIGDRGGHAVTERLEPARPTLDAMLLLELVRLRLADLTLPTPVERVTLTVEGTRADDEQLALFRGDDGGRDPAAAGRALARVRALFGDDAVVRPALRPAHLPEARFAWEPLRDGLPGPSRRQPTRSPDEPPRLRVVRDGDLPDRPLVRRLYAEPRALPGGPGDLALSGPWRTSGGWWVREVARDYYYGTARDGAVYWLFHDRARDRWFLQGEVD